VHAIRVASAAATERHSMVAVPHTIGGFWRLELMIRWYTEQGAVGQSENRPHFSGRWGGVLMHVSLSSWVVAMILLSTRGESAYDALVQEDRVVEWATVFLFLAAAIAFTGHGWMRRRVGDWGVALFCLVAAGEEISWGQRVLGFTPSETFLQRNAQQEANLHNLVEAFGQPKWSLIAVIAAYGILIPVVARTVFGRRLLDRFGLTVPSWPVASWFLASALLLIWYPVRFTGEWVEAMVGALFLLSAPLRTPPLVGATAAAFAAALLAERVSARASADPAQLDCARAEARAILEGVLADPSSDILLRRGSTHRRLYTLWSDADLDPELFTTYRAVECRTSAEYSKRRRRYGVDPWGTAYWVRVGSGTPARRLVSVYSFGPNRRRDANDVGANAGDDVVASAP
jgi:hypothetical protein